MRFSEVKDTYAGIAEDIEKLKTANRLIAWKHPETEEWVLHSKQDEFGLQVDEDVRTAWLKQPVSTVLLCKVKTIALLSKVLLQCSCHWLSLL